MDVIFCEAVGRQVLRTAGAMVQKGELCYDYHPNGRLRRVGLIQYSETPLVERRCDWDQVAVLLDFSYDPWGRRIHNDHRGAPVFMTDRDARVVWTAMYRPYGEAYVDDDPDGDGTLVTSNLRYPGQYEDTIEDFPEGERLYYNVMRYYDPGLGRYIAPERDSQFIINGSTRRTGFSIYTIIIPGSLKDRYLSPEDLNSFRYALGNPLTYKDPLGLQSMYGSNIPQPYQGCLIEIFGAGCIWRSKIVYADVPKTFSFGNTIIVGWDTPDLLSEHWTTLHEYFHVCKQWAKSRYGEFFWRWFGGMLWSILTTGSMQEMNPAEREASAYAHHYLFIYKACIHPEESWYDPLWDLIREENEKSR